MSVWQRKLALEGSTTRHSEEIWIHTPKEGVSSEYPMQITNGKPFDVLSLKSTNLNETRNYIDFLRQTAAALYAPDAPRRTLVDCPCCGADNKTHAKEYDVFHGIPYYRCSACGHGFVLQQPTEKALKTLFTDSDDHSTPYIDQDSLAARMQEIIAPKVDWLLTIYKDCYGQRPRCGIDVGAGGGHFVEGMRREGLEAVGYELSRASRRFAEAVFGIGLKNEDFLTAEPNPVDLVTFWGLLEYTPEPRRFLDAARRCLQPDNGLIVVEVPRLDALGTTAQAQNPFSIARHMVPTSHVNVFSDASLATALIETGFKPVAAWYFGMDIYELLIQTALRMDDTTVIKHLADMIPSLQQSLDSVRLCDDLVLAAVPVG